MELCAFLRFDEVPPRPRRQFVPNGIEITIRKHFCDGVVRLTRAGCKIQKSDIRIAQNAVLFMDSLTTLLNDGTMSSILAAPTISDPSLNRDLRNF